LLGDYEDVDIDVTQQLITAILPILINAGLLSSGQPGVASSEPSVGVLNYEDDVASLAEVTIQIENISVTFTFNLSKAELSYAPDG